ncbi:MAG: hypothetical protein NXI24_19940 [bacterium]|nr:hypothetical protein [bacterium]
MIQTSEYLRNDRIGRKPSMKIPALAIAAMLLFLRPVASPGDSAGILADSAPLTALPGGNVRPVNDSEIHLDSEVVRIHLGRENYRVEVRYEFRNAGKARTVAMGFPIRKQDTHMTSPIRDFEAALLVSGREEALKVTPKASPDAGVSSWNLFETFSVPFAAGQRRTVINRYEQIYQGVNYDHDYDEVKYILRTGALWAGKIKKARFEIIFDGLNPEDVRSRIGLFPNEELKRLEYYPYAGLTIEGGKGKVIENEQGFVIEYFNIEPDFDLVLRLPHRLHSWAHVSSAAAGDDAKNSYGAKQAIDNDVRTAWVEGVDGPGAGESITIVVGPPMQGGKIRGWYLIEGVEIVNGCARNEKLFRANARVRTLRLALNTLSEHLVPVGESRFGPGEEHALNDSRDPQVLEFARPIFVSELKLTILSVYPGEKYQDTCIAEIRALPVRYAKEKDLPY